ncbi:MAG: glycosyltransferase family 39 protein [Lachnospiraceae bacterium]|nr:glycosyltransferase family 39 protein [Lachnospiraceae bacterium]
MKEKDLKINILIALSVIIVLAFDVFFVSQKEGYHMDEILSYELSNSEFTPWITPTQPEGRLEKYYRNEIYDKNFGKLLSNLFGQIGDILSRRSASTAASYTADVYDSPQWMSSAEMLEYVTYYSTDSVPALSAYYNSTTDNHPPLYFMLLNIFSAVYSIFASGRLSVWPGCFLNMIFMAGSLVLINLFFRDIVHKKYLGPLAALFYGLSPAGINTVTLIRMYSMTAFWCLAFTYILLRKLEDGEDFKKKNKLLILVTVLGFLTQYFVCIYYFFLLVGVCIYLFRKGQKKTVLYLTRSMLISAVWGVGLYPFVFHDLFGTRIGDSVRESLTNASGFAGKLMTFTCILFEETAWSVPAAMAMLVLVIIGSVFSVRTKRLKAYAPMLCLALLAYLLVVSKIAPYTVDRYLMPVFPIVSICFTMGVAFTIIILGETFFKSDSLKAGVFRMSWGACCIMCIGFVFITRSDYLFEGYGSQVRLSEKYSSYDALVVYDGTGFYRNVPELINYKDCLLLKEDELGVYYERLASCDKLIVIEGIGVSRENVLGVLGETYGYSSVTVLMEDGAHGDRVCLLSK